MDYVKNNLEAVNDWLENLNDSDLSNIHKEYCQQANYMDDEVFSNDDEFFNTFFPHRVMDALRAAEYGDYKFIDKYVKFDGQGNLESSEYLEELIDLEELAQYIFNNPSEFSDYVELEEEEDEDDI